MWGSIPLRAATVIINSPTLKKDVHFAHLFFTHFNFHTLSLPLPHGLSLFFLFFPHYLRRIQAHAPHPPALQQLMLS